MSWRITLDGSGQQFNCDADSTVLDAALAAGITLPYGCRGGSCGACLGAVLVGEIEYPDGTPPGISQAEIDAGKALFCQAKPKSDLRIQARIVESASEVRVRTLPARVDAMERLADDVMRLFLKLPKSERLQFLPGQYLDILLKSGHRRAFSIANAPHDDDRIELHLRHVEGGEFTDFVFTDMKAKALLRIEGPQGTFVLDEASDRPMLMMGGGTGFAPLKSMLEHLFAEQDSRPKHLFWGVRGAADLYLGDLAEAWQQEHPEFRFTPVLSDPDEHWAGARGWVHEALIREYPALEGHDLYMSGPPAMIQAARAAFLDAGLPEGQLYFDSFDLGAETRD